MFYTSLDGKRSYLKFADSIEPVNIPNIDMSIFEYAKNTNQRILAMYHLLRERITLNQILVYVEISNDDYPRLGFDVVTEVIDALHQNLIFKYFYFEDGYFVRIKRYIDGNQLGAFLYELDMVDPVWSNWILTEICQLTEVSFPQDETIRILANIIEPNEMCIIADRLEEIGFVKQPILNYMRLPFHHQDSWILKALKGA